MEPSTQLARFGFRDPDASARGLPEGWTSHDAWLALLKAVGGAPEPDAALRRLHRLEAVELALPDPEQAAPLLAIVGFGDYLTDVLARTPGLAAELAGGAAATPADLRAFRDIGITKIAAADLSAEPTTESFRAAGRALADLADACLQRALDDVGAGGLVVLGMGKYGAQELNYASDIDVLFVAPDGDDGHEALARRVMETMNGPPTVFRTDADLRPEGRDGPLVRSLDAFRSYYERWAQVWEFQSLIKCRFVAGDAEVGDAFMTMIEPYVWPDTLAGDAIEQVRSLKARAEREITRRGLDARQVKLAPGGIRDCEFAVQLLQLVHARHHPELRSCNTLTALAALGAEGYVAPEDAEELADAYVFLRHTEHRLQLVAGRQTHTLPTAGAKREQLARGLGFRDDPDRSALDAFEERWAKTTAVVRRIHERLFYRPLLESFATRPAVGVGLSDEVADERLAALGFDTPPRVRAAAQDMTSGPSRRAKVMRAIMPGVLGWLAETPEPDEGMLRFADVVGQLGDRPHLFALLRDEPPATELLCEAVGTGGVLSGLLERNVALLAALGGSSEAAADARTAAVALAERADDADAALGALRTWKDGRFLRIAARDLASGDDPESFPGSAAELSDVGVACLDAAFVLAREEQAERTGGVPPGAFAVLGLGRLGGRELSYASDLDVIYVYERDGECPDGTEARLFWSAVAERIGELLGTTPPIFKVDAELRPEGRNGPIVRSLESTLTYYQRWAELWEFQAFVRARHCAGGRALSYRLLDAVAPQVWRAGLSEAELTEIRRIKLRIEKERVKGRSDPRFQVKLGVGGLNDVEFTVQLLQMQHAHRVVDARTANTLEALEALRDAGVVEPTDARWLSDAYVLLNRVRNHMFLLRGLPTDDLPRADGDLEKLARSLGYPRPARSAFVEDYRRVTRRARTVTTKLFYGEEDR